MGTAPGARTTQESAQLAPGKYDQVLRGQRLSQAFEMLQV